MTLTNSIFSRLVPLAVVLAGALTGCSSERQPVAAAPETVHNISVLPVQRADVPDLLEAVGTVRAAQTSQLASQMAGNIVEIRVHEGDRVRRGQALAVIDDAQPRAALDRATAAESAAGQEVAASDSDLALAQSTLKRYQNLYDKKSVSPQEFDEVKARYQAAVARRDMTQAGQAQAEAALAQARTSFSYTHRRAFRRSDHREESRSGHVCEPWSFDLHGRGPGTLPIGSHSQRKRSAIHPDGTASAGCRGRTAEPGTEGKSHANRACG